MKKVWHLGDGAKAGRVVPDVMDKVRKHHHLPCLRCQRAAVHHAGALVPLQIHLQGLLEIEDTHRGKGLR